MLTDVVEGSINSDNLSLGWIDQEAVCEQCILFKSTKWRQCIACSGLHGITVTCRHEMLDL